MRFQGVNEVGNLLKFRLPVSSDSVEIGRLTKVLGYHSDLATIGERLQLLLFQPNHFLTVVQREADFLVGWVHAEHRTLLTSEACVEVLGLVVDPNFRGYGVGRELIRSVEIWGAQRGLSEICVRSNIVRPESHPFYENLGYRLAKTQHVYRKSMFGS